ncbi:LPS export ABC transporter periplasmic protein LptC [Bartonella sp. F02]|uniref:LPS export ABC transporter periplasmic protein LptC n=1 Tax=Bartonella sp. F02 TaxID=2967262 RepID=UPI0022A979B5|nr:LPS export ABC transporter periplasmic protein LptC [Bartonella sp. F02]MCZ2327943.1 LPS export ABC transporter periplasmic protein LptC [Bartonella sp. F02]
MIIRNHSEFFTRKSSFGDIFKIACHHSRRVRFLKVFLPFSALIIMLFFFWFTFFSVPASSDRLILNHEEDGVMRLAMINPKLEGYTRSRKPYWLKAEKAFQDRTRSGMIELLNITAEIPAGKQGSFFIDAQGGVYDNINGYLQLDKPFTVTIKDKMIAQFLDANINLSEGQLKTNQRIDIQYTTGLSLTANALQVREKGQSLYFKGGVHLIVDRR